jgi:hypothetical protein
VQLSPDAQPKISHGTGCLQPFRGFNEPGLDGGDLICCEALLDGRLYLPVTELLAEWASSQPPRFAAVRIAGLAGEARAHELGDFFTRGAIPYRFHAADTEAGQALLAEASQDGSRLPVLVFYILTGRDLLRDGALPAEWPLPRPPLLLETSVPGVFAVGDVRAGSVKRVASAAGAGAIAVQLVHDYLSEERG